MIDRLRELLRAWDFETYPGPFHIEQHDHPDQWWLNNAMGDSMALDTSDAELVVNALPELLDAHDRMAGALRRIAEVLDQSGGDRFAIEARGVARAALAVPKEENPE
jgi:hypothetical protein